MPYDHFARRFSDSLGLGIRLFPTTSLRLDTPLLSPFKADDDARRDGGQAGPSSSSGSSSLLPKIDIKDYTMPKGLKAAPQQKDQARSASARTRRQFDSYATDDMILEWVPTLMMGEGLTASGIVRPGSGATSAIEVDDLDKKEMSKALSPLDDTASRKRAMVGSDIAHLAGQVCSERRRPGALPHVLIYGMSASATASSPVLSSPSSQSSQLSRASCSSLASSTQRTPPPSPFIAAAPPLATLARSLTALGVVVCYVDEEVRDPAWLRVDRRLLGTRETSEGSEGGDVNWIDSTFDVLILSTPPIGEDAQTFKELSFTRIIDWTV